MAILMYLVGLGIACTGIGEKYGEPYGWIFAGGGLMAGAIVWLVTDALGKG